MATNMQLINEALAFSDFVYDGNNLNTFAEWKKLGYSVKKGEKAFLKVDLWKPFDKKVKETDENGKEVEKKEKRFMLKTSHLFTPDQVEPLKERKIKKRTYKKKTVKAG